MPNYDYRCSHCGNTLEAFQKISDAALTKCPDCGQSTLVRGPGGGIGLQFQGTGFYITDYGPRCKDQKGNAKKDDMGTAGCCPCKDS